MPQSLGREQIAECMRCGEKVRASELQSDGRNPRLLVCQGPGCWDPAHPQERPFQPNDVEGKPRFPVAPDHIQNTAPVLSLGDDTIPPQIVWTPAGTIGPRVESYRVYRATGAGAFSLLDTLEVEFGGAPQYEVDPPELFEDSTAVADTQYRYRVDAITQDGRTIASNVLTVTTEA